MKRVSSIACCFLVAVLSISSTHGAIPAAVKADVMSPFGTSPLTGDQLKALNEILAVSDPAPAPAKPAAAPAPAKPSKLKPVKKQEPAKPADRTIDATDSTGKVTSITVDVTAGTFTSLKVPAAQAAAVKSLLTSLNLTAAASGTDKRGR